MKNNDQYTSKTYTSSTGVIVTIRRPILTPEERERRENLAKAAMCRLYEECVKQGVEWPTAPCHKDETIREIV
ncbi:MAG: hypothetical protein K2I93_01075 [Oscillospiraceae bacterium]|nr:hypothetical protein [Oscillospiraceae bacterium]